MAVWQFDLYFLPADATPPSTRGVYWDAPTLLLGDVHQAQEHLEHYFGSPWLMLEDWIVFGPESGNRVDVQFDQELTASIFVRCDLRCEAPQFLSIVADLASMLKCVLFCVDNEELMQPETHRLMKAAETRRGTLSAAHLGFLG